MRKLFALLGIVGAVSFGAIGVAAAAAPPPVTLSGKTNVHGQRDVSAKSKVVLKFEQDDFYFSPTFVKVKPGEKLKITIRNEGKTAHTFTSTALHIDKTLQPDKTTKIKVTIPAAGGTIQFHCTFHQSMGMQGAFYTGSSSAETTGSTAATTVALANTTLGKVLVDADGRTLYQLDADSATSATCTGACATLWPPVTTTGTPTAGTGLDGSKLSIVSGPNGSQVSYAGHPLYRYSADKAAGDLTGQGVAGKWWVLGADGTTITTAAATSTSTNSGY